MALATLGTMAWECTPMRSTKMPREQVLDEKLGLLGFLDVRRAEIGRRDGVPVDLAQLIQPRAELGVERSRVRQRERPAPPVRRRPLHDLMQIGLQMDDRLLAAPIGKFGMVRAVDDIQHNRARTKIERNAIAHAQSGDGRRREGQAAVA